MRMSLTNTSGCSLERKSRADSPLRAKLAAKPSREKTSQSRSHVIGSSSTTKMRGSSRDTFDDLLSGSSERMGLRHRQREAKCRPLILLAEGFDPATVFSHDFSRNGQSK